MRSTRKMMVGLVAAAALAASGSYVYAQQDRSPDTGGYQSAGPGAGHGMRGHGPRDGQRRHGRWSNPAAAVEGHLAALKVELKITPEQDNAWQAFADKSRQLAQARIAQRGKRSAQQPADKLTAPERLAQRTARMKQGLASMEARTVAVTDLYGVLTPEQKTIADQQFARGQRGGFGGRHQRRG